MARHAYLQQTRSCLRQKFCAAINPSSQPDTMSMSSRCQRVRRERKIIIRSIIAQKKLEVQALDADQSGDRHIDRVLRAPSDLRLKKKRQICVFFIFSFTQAEFKRKSKICNFCIQTLNFEFQRHLRYERGSRLIVAKTEDVGPARAPQYLKKHF